MGRLPVWSIQSLPAFWFEMLQSSFGSYFYSLSFSTSSRMGKVVKEGSTAATKSVAEAVAGINANSFSLLSYSKSCASLPSVINQWQCSRFAYLQDTGLSIYQTKIDVFLGSVAQNQELGPGTFLVRRRF